MSDIKVRSLAELKTLRRAIAEAAARDAERKRALAEAQKKAQREQNLFREAVGAVKALRGQEDRIWLAPQPPEPLPVQRERDEESVLRESLSDGFDVSTLLDTDDQLSFRRTGVGPDVTRKLRAGQWSIQRQLDLHGLRTDEAREALGEFIRLSFRTGVRCVRIVHGKGLGSPGKTPVLKGRVQSWLVQKKEVLAFVQARPAEGGAGALVVLLQPSQRRVGR
ncbi:Endonuclease MutS2 [bioreactor metagenome]|uniref:Endonuclease MutS2 n=1 Tax=bioreactor metagenome TaxID=1076179 RepID=A0A645BU60_9ZZZZ